MPLESLFFMQIDARNLPLADAIVDAVINVESCHHYPVLCR